MSTEIHYANDLNTLHSKIHIIERKPKKDPRVFLKIIKICRNFKPDIIHTWGSMPTIYAIPAKILLKIKLINGMIINAPIKLPAKMKIRALITFLFSDIIISNSNAGIRIYKPPLNKTLCIHNGFNFNRLNKLVDTEDIRLKFGITTTFIVGMVGRFEKDKDFGSFILSGIETLKIRKDITFIAVGGGYLLNDIKNSIPPVFKKVFIFTWSTG
ncbi:MAG: hypothetical protein HC831_13775 [Chloroflexia bacterium]|nr:hypothetical protein [Chloroflexia bacterium]